MLELIANSGYDRAYGPVHLQRRVERLLLEPLASVHAQDVIAEALDGMVK